MRRFRLPILVTFSCLSLFLVVHLLCPGQSFDDFTMELFRHELSGDALSLHYTLTDPFAYGIEPSAPSLGNMDTASMEEKLSYLETCLEKTEHYLHKNLGMTKENMLTAEILKWWLEGQITAGEYYYYQEPIGPTLGIQAQLPVLLAEYNFRDQEDIDTYLLLLESLPDYFEQIGDFEKEKAEQGLFMNDEILNKVLAQCESLFPVNDSHFLVTSFAERLETCSFLTADQCISYEAQNLRMLNESVQPAYDSLCQNLESLRGTGTNSYGLYHTPDGIDYYEYLLRYSIGTDLSMADIHRMLELQMEADYETILYGLHQGIQITTLTSDLPAQESPSEILTDLQSQIQEDFPIPEDISWQVKEVPGSLQNFLSPAFYMTPAIDAKEQNTIYINPSYSPDRTDLITTLAHEGYPGHLYQNSFENTDSYNPVRNLFYIGGYTEGWGLYSEFYAYDYLGLSDDEANLLRALSSLNYAICASLDLSIHGQGWTEDDCVQYLSSFGITNQQQIHELYLNILEEPSNYLKYYLGYLEICKLKENALSRSPDITIYDFHKWFLTIGPAPFFLLEERLEFLEVSSKLLQSCRQNIQLSFVQSVHDRLNHFLMERGMLLISGSTFFRQGEKHHSFILCTADTGHIAFLHQAIDRCG